MNLIKLLNGYVDKEGNVMAHMNSKYDYDINKRLHKLPNKMHLQACIDGGNIYKNRKKYNRKVKHKNRFMSDLGYE